MLTCVLIRLTAREKIALRQRSDLRIWARFQFQFSVSVLFLLPTGDYKFRKKDNTNNKNQEIQLEKTRTCKIRKKYGLQIKFLCPCSILRHGKIMTSQRKEQIVAFLFLSHGKFECFSRCCIRGYQFYRVTRRFHHMV